LPLKLTSQTFASQPLKLPAPLIRPPPLSLHLSKKAFLSQTLGSSHSTSSSQISGLSLRLLLCLHLSKKPFLSQTLGSSHSTYSSQISCLSLHLLLNGRRSLSLPPLRSVLALKDSPPLSCPNALRLVSFERCVVHSLSLVSTVSGLYSR